ncbi:MAG: ABC transporter ATP-binding protein [Desulfuromonas sp.]
MLKFEQVSYGYSPDGQLAPVVENLSLEIPAGQFLCVLGPSGCGKTTLLHLAAGFLHPQQGQLSFQGRPITGPHPERALVFQDATLFPWLRVMDNVAFGLRQRGVARAERRRLALQMLEQVGLAATANAWPMTLSGGMRQRVAIARVLALQPAALLMDEPFSALDANSRERLQDLLLQLWQTRRQTLLYITHSVEEAAYLADRVLIFGPAPQSLRADLINPVPRPRDRSAPQLLHFCQQLRQQLAQLPCCLAPTILPPHKEFPPCA